MQAEALAVHILGHLQKKSPSQLVVLASCGDTHVVAQITISANQLKALQDGVQDLHGFVESGTPPLTARDFEQFGTKLFDTFLVHDARRLLDRVSKAAAVLPLHLRFDDASLAAWPWEYLYDSSRRMFLCQEFNPISRGIYTLTIAPFKEPIQRELSVLVVLGVPPDDATTTPLEERQLLDDVFKSHVSDNVHLTFIEGDTPTRIQQTLRNGSFDIFHFYGHAAFDAGRGEGYLALKHDPRQAIKLYGNDLARLLATEGLTLAFLNACETGRVDGEDAGRSAIAAALLDRGIPAVIATQFSLPDNSAHFLSATIYNALLGGAKVSDAVRDGRHAMGFSNNGQFFDWGIPVLYTTAPHLQLRPPPTRARVTLLDAETSLHIEQIAHRPGTKARIALTDFAAKETLGIEELVVRPGPQTRIALADLDAKVPFLPQLTKRANKAQQVFEFSVLYPPKPMGVVRTDLGEPGSGPQLYLPRLQAFLENQLQVLDVEHACFLTRFGIAGEDGGGPFSDYLSANLHDAAGKGVVVSTNGLREYAREAGVSYAKSVLYISLAQVLANARLVNGFHEKTVGCPFDFCYNLADVVVGLRKMRFDHKPCRNQIKDVEVLQAIDALLQAEIDLDATEPLANQAPLFKP